MIIPNSAVRLLDKAVTEYGDKTAVSDEWESYSFNQLQQAGHRIATAILKYDDGGYMPQPVMVYLPKSGKCIASLMGAM